ncbi:hypothetical protein DPMN_028245 [Dreissena polymorpha]|uniref:Uncharacterized protein n=1 Tax=Dreissena polymorpha TaxID=45954 RepID=A0A9D4LWD3_DREPO|nr:hypothetical protein DPMN_028245 [Dreissena polymorpha]
MLLEQHIAARAGILLLEQHLNAARPVNCCSSSNMLLEQHLNAARAAFFSARAEVKVSTPLVRHTAWTILKLTMMPETKKGLSGD